jgi:hypothetical protein
MDDFWEDEALSPEELAADRASERQLAELEAVGEVYNARWSFD